MSAETFSSLANPGVFALNLSSCLSAKQTVYFQGYRILTCPVSNMSQSNIYILMAVIPLIFSQVKLNCPLFLFNIITDSIFQYSFISTFLRCNYAYMLDLLLFCVHSQREERTACVSYKILILLSLRINSIMLSSQLHNALRTSLQKR